MAALLGIFSGAGIANKDPQNPLAMWLMGGGIGIAVLIVVLYGVGAFLRYKNFEPVWVTHGLMFSGAVLVLLFMAVVFGGTLIKSS